MNIESSEPTLMVMPSGRPGAISAAAALTALATASVFAPDWRTIPSPTAGLPFIRNAE